MDNNQLPLLHGSLSKAELKSLIPDLTTYQLQKSWSSLETLLRTFPEDIQSKVIKAAEDKALKKRKRQTERRHDRRIRQRLEDHHVEHFTDSLSSDTESQFMALPNSEQVKERYRHFLEAVSNEALQLYVCVVCAREKTREDGGSEQDLLSMPHCPEKLKPVDSHPQHDYYHEMLILKELVQEVDGRGRGWVCGECFRALKKGTRPKFSLSNGLWIGPVPHELQILTIAEQLLIARHFPRVFVFKLYPRDRGQRMHPNHLMNGLRGNVTLFQQNTSAIAQMLEGQMMPHPCSTLPSLVTVTFIGRKTQLPKSWLRSTFRVNRNRVYEALLFLKAHNPLYHDIEVSYDRLQTLPEDDIPAELINVVRVNEDESVAEREEASYDPEEDDEQDEMAGNNQDGEAIIPLKSLGVSDVDLTSVSASELMRHALENILKPSGEGGYAIRSGLPVSEFGFDRQGNPVAGQLNPLMAAYPSLWPYGEGGIEVSRPIKISFTEHTRWCLQFHDKRFRTHHSFPHVAFGLEQKRKAMLSAQLQMRRKDFDVDGPLLAKLTVEELKEAAEQESRNEPITNTHVQRLLKHFRVASGRVMGSDHARISYRSLSWGMILGLNPCVIWMTVNPKDLDNPIVQIFAGEKIDMDFFDSSAGPDSQRRALNVANDPDAATKFFFFIIKTVLNTLFGIDCSGGRVRSEMGLLGELAGYFGVVEAQGRGTLHVHTLIWLKHAPNASRMLELLNSETFRQTVVAYLRRNVRAHVELGKGLDTQPNRTRPSHIGYSLPPHPDLPEWEQKMTEREYDVVQSCQVHTCKKGLCLRKKPGRAWKCKRRAPWKTSDDDVVNADGSWFPKRLNGFMNNYCPAISTALACNNDIKLLTNGRDTQDVLWYTQSYQTKKQGKSYNLSALLASTLLYHQSNKAQFETIQEQNRLLLFRCMQAANREMELSAPQVIAYLTGDGDYLSSHNFVPLYYNAIRAALCREFPALKKSDLSSKNLQQSRAPEDNLPPEHMLPEGDIARDDSGDENVSLAKLPEGGLYARSQLLDYCLRGLEMEHFCMWDFIRDSREVDLRDDRRYAANHDDEGLEQGHEPGPKRGRPRNERSRYLQDHPKHATHQRILRTPGHNTLVNIAGPFLPRSDDEDQYDLYCASMLALFKPWRRYADLKPPSQSWSSAFTQFSSSAPPAIQDIIANAQFYYDARRCSERKRSEDMDNDEPERFRPSEGFEDDEGANVDGDDADSTDSDEDGSSDGDSDGEGAISGRERNNAKEAIEIAQFQGVFEYTPPTGPLCPESTSQVNTEFITIADSLAEDKIQHWQLQLAESIARNTQQEMPAAEVEGRDSVLLAADLVSEQEGGVTGFAQFEVPFQDSITAANPAELTESQRYAFDIVAWHMEQTLAGADPPQLLLVIPGEGGTGKSKTIQTITEHFHSKGVPQWLVKCAFTGIAASLIGGQTIHTVAGIPINKKEQSRAKQEEMELFWAKRQYLIIDEYSMVSRSLLAKISRLICTARKINQRDNEPFGGLAGVVLVGDLHQFPPVANGKHGSLYCPTYAGQDDSEAVQGRHIYEQFQHAIRLREQMRADTEYLDFLRHVRHGCCKKEHLDKLRQHIITSPLCPPTDYTSGPWKYAELITPRHSVRVRWNEEMTRKHAKEEGKQLLISPAVDEIKGRELTRAEKRAKRKRTKGDPGKNRKERAGLMNKLAMFIGMRVMVTFNVSTDLDIANGARGEIVKIVLDEREEPSTDPVVQLRYPPACVIVKLDRTRAGQLDGLELGEVPIIPMQRRYKIMVKGQSKSVTRTQLPITAAYAFTDYRSQGQTLARCYIDLGRPAWGELTPFNAYVALSRAKSWDGIRLIREFDDHLFTQHPSEYLRDEDERLNQLDKETRAWWDEVRDKNEN